MFLIPISVPTFRFSLPKHFVRLLAPKKFFITTFGPYFLVNSCLEVIFFYEIFQKWVQYYDNLSKSIFFLTKHELNMNFYVFGA